MFDITYIFNALNQRGQELYTKGQYKDAAEAFKICAIGEHAEARFNFGICYFYGKGIEQNYENARYWLQEAAMQNEPKALEFIKKNCIVLGDNAYDAKEYKNALDLYTQASLNEVWHKKASCLQKLGETEPAISILKDILKNQPTLNEKVSMRAKELGNNAYESSARDNYNTALAYYNYAVEIKDDFSIAWCNKAICHDMLNNPEDAIQALVKAIENNPRYEKAIALLAKIIGLQISSQDDSKIQFIVSVVNHCLSISRDNKLRDKIKETVGEITWKKYFIDAKEKNSATEAQFLIATHYAEGNNLTKNKKLAMQWYKKAADNGHLEAQKIYAAYCIKKHSDYKTAAEYYELALRQGDVKIQFQLGYCYEYLKDFEKAIEYYEKCASNEETLSFPFSRLANLYFFGPGQVKKDYEKAAKYYQLECKYRSAWELWSDHLNTALEISDGNTAFASQDYQKALEHFQEAERFSATISYVNEIEKLELAADLKEKITRCQRLLEQEKAKNAEIAEIKEPSCDLAPTCLPDEESPKTTLDIAVIDATVNLETFEQQASDSYKVISNSKPTRTMAPHYSYNKKIKTANDKEMLILLGELEAYEKISSNTLDLITKWFKTYFEFRIGECKDFLEGIKSYEKLPEKIKKDWQEWLNKNEMTSEQSKEEKSIPVKLAKEKTKTDPVEIIPTTSSFVPTQKVVTAAISSNNLPVVEVLNVPPSLSNKAKPKVKEPTHAEKETTTFPGQEKHLSEKVATTALALPLEGEIVAPKIVLGTANKDFTNLENFGALWNRMRDLRTHIAKELRRDLNRSNVNPPPLSSPGSLEKLLKSIPDKETASQFLQYHFCFIHYNADKMGNTKYRRKQCLSLLNHPLFFFKNILWVRPKERIAPKKGDSPQEKDTVFKVACEYGDPVIVQRLIKVARIKWGENTEFFKAVMAFQDNEHLSILDRINQFQNKNTAKKEETPPQEISENEKFQDRLITLFNQKKEKENLEENTLISQINACEKLNDLNKIIQNNEDYKLEKNSLHAIIQRLIHWNKKDKQHSASLWLLLVNAFHNNLMSQQDYLTSVKENFSEEELLTLAKSTPRHLWLKIKLPQSLLKAFNYMLVQKDIKDVCLSGSMATKLIVKALETLGITNTQLKEIGAAFKDYKILDWDFILDGEPDRPKLIKAQFAETLKPGVFNYNGEINFKSKVQLSVWKDIGKQVDFTIAALSLTAEGELQAKDPYFNDLLEGKLRSIGDFSARLLEDPVRILRSIKYELLKFAPIENRKLINWETFLRHPFKNGFLHLMPSLPENLVDFNGQFFLIGDRLLEIKGKNVHKSVDIGQQTGKQDIALSIEEKNQLKIWQGEFRRFMHVLSCEIKKGGTYAKDFTLIASTRIPSIAIPNARACNSQQSFNSNKPVFQQRKLSEKSTLAPKSSAIAHNAPANQSAFSKDFWNNPVSDEQIKRLPHDDKSKELFNLQRNAEKYGYACINVEPDGNCFYSAVADQFNLILNLKLSPPKMRKLAEELRQLACDYVEKHSHYFNPFKDKSFKLAEQRKDRVWVDDIVITALGHALNINFVIVRSDSSEELNIKRVAYKPVTTLFLGYQVGLHYQSLHPLVGNEQQQQVLLKKVQTQECSQSKLSITVATPDELKIKLEKLMSQTKCGKLPVYPPSIRQPQNEQKETPNNQGTVAKYPSAFFSPSRERKLVAEDSQCASKFK